MIDYFAAALDELAHIDLGLMRLLARIFITANCCVRSRFGTGSSLSRKQL